MSARVRSACLSLCISLLAAVSANAQTDQRPNILLIVADDMGYADIGVHGSRDIPTPHIDALAQSGIRFTDAYVSGPYCSPTRAGLLTGRYPQRFGYEYNPGMAGRQGLPPEQRTLADHLRAAGYRTALLGKWHLGSSAEQHPLERGFDEFFGFLGGAHPYLDPLSDRANAVQEGRNPVAAMDYLTDELGARAEAFLRRPHAQPFFLYLAFNAVHTPLEATESYLTRVAGIADTTRRTYAAMLVAMDDAIGRALAALRETGLEENTLIVFFSDNGGPTMMGTSVNGSRNAPLRGSKRQTWEGGIRVPFIMRWKGTLPEAVVDARPIIQLDVFPTVLAAARVPLDPGGQLDGVNLLPYLTGRATGNPHEALYWRMGEHAAIRSGDWKLVRSSEGPLRGVVATDLADAQLFNLAQDIGEQHDLAAAHPARVQQLAAAWRRWSEELAAPAWNPPPLPPRTQ